MKQLEFYNGFVIQYLSNGNWIIRGINYEYSTIEEAIAEINLIGEFNEYFQNKED